MYCCLRNIKHATRSYILPEPDAVEDTFLSGSSLHRLGLNNAAEYWQAREAGNYCMLRHKGTRFWVVRGQSTDAELSRKLLVDKATARSLVHLFYLGGKQLADALAKLSIWREESQFEELHYYFRATQ